MKNKLFATAALSVMLLNPGVFSFADTRPATAKRAQVGQLVSLLPASDGVVTLDAKRFFGDALPRLLAAKPAMLGDITKKIDEVQTKTGIDVRQFETVAVGVNVRKTGPSKFDMDPVILARGQVNAPGLIGAAKLAANAKYREERVGARTIYIFSAKDVAAQAKSPSAPGVADKVLGNLSDDIAVTAYDANTIAFGTPARLRETLEAKTHVGTDLTGLLGRKEVSVANFALKTPEGMTSFLPLDNDELGKSLGSIRYLFGSMDMAADAAVFNLTAKTLQNAQAQSLFETLQGLQVIGKAALGGSKSPEKQVYVRLIDSAKITTNGSEVALDLRVPQADIDILVGSLK